MHSRTLRGREAPGRTPAAAIEAFATVCQLLSSSEGLLWELELQIIMFFTKPAF